LYAEGTEAKPIKFKTVEDYTQWIQASWKIISLSGPYTAGSQLKYCEFIGGTGGVHGGIYYTGALNILHAENITITHSLFASNQHPSDDLLHIAKSSHITIVDSRFSNASADAIDADISDVKILRNQFNNINNDSIDLMETQALINENILTHSGDKGISVGEGSRLNLSRNRFQENILAVAVKDQSRALITDNLFIDNKTDIAGYKKSEYYYTGGTIITEDNKIIKKGLPANAKLNIDEFSCINESCLYANLSLRGPAKQHLRKSYLRINSGWKKQDPLE
jgi:hypothetical protein